MSSLFAPVQTTLPDLKIKAVVLGSRMRMIQAAKRFGLYSEFFARSAIERRSSSHPRLKVLTMFYSFGRWGDCFVCNDGGYRAETLVIEVPLSTILC